MSHWKSLSLSSLLHPMFFTHFYSYTAQPLYFVSLYSRTQSCLWALCVILVTGLLACHISSAVCTCLPLCALHFSLLFTVFFLLFPFLCLPKFFFCLLPLGHTSRVILNNGKRSLRYFQYTCPFLSPPIFKRSSPPFSSTCPTAWRNLSTKMLLKTENYCHHP